MKSLAIICVLLLGHTISALAGRVERTYYFSTPSISHSGEYQMIELENTMLTALPGQPVLPYRQVNLMLPPGESAVSIEILFSDEVSMPGSFNIYPQQEFRPVSSGNSGNFSKDIGTYSRNALLPVDPKGKLINSFLNGRSFALTTFTPARYNPVTGNFSYFSTARVVIHTASDDKAVSALNNLSARSNQALRLADNKEMEQAYKTMRQPLSDGYDFLIISPVEFANSFTSMRGNYLKEGITSLVVTRDSIATSMTGMDMPEKIRNFIIQEYQTHGIQYVLLAGDDEQIPHRGFYCYVTSGSGYTDQNIPADLYYSALDGNWNNDGDALWGEPGEDDLLPDVAVARMPFSDSFELNKMLNKSFKYQFTPVAGEFRNILMAGENLWSNPDTWGSDYLELLKGEHSDNGYTTIGIPVDYPFDHLYDEVTYWSGQDLMDHLNQGRPMLNHVGHANETYVMKLGNSDITNSNFYGLNGTDHNYTIVYTHGCLCGAFDYNDCIAEKMVTIDNFAAAFVGNSRYGWFNEGQTEGPSAHLHREYMDALYTDSLNRIGRAHMESKIATASWVTAPGQWEPGALRWCFYDCNVLGDPMLAVFTDNPIEINTNYPATVLIGSASMSVNVVSGSSSAAGLTCVVIKNGLVIGQAVTDASGQAEIIFDVMVQDPGEAQLIVSGYNCTPVLYNFAFITVAGPYVVHAVSMVNDPSGNNNNLADYGEMIMLTNGMRNVGGTDANDVMVTLITSDPYVTITDSIELYSTIPAGDTLTINDAYTFTLADSVPDGHVVQFILKAVSGATWLSEYYLVCNAPVLSAGSLGIDDASGGNGNGKLDPGETVTFNITSYNTGHSACLNAIGTISTSCPWINIISGEYQIGTLGAGASSNAQFVAEVSSDAPEATIVELVYSISSGDYLTSTTYYPTIKLIVEDFEAGNFTRFPWKTFGPYLWAISTDSPLEGVYCSKSASIGDAKQSGMSITLNVLQDDSISFYSKVSSEAIFDKLQFFIDIQPMDEWSGMVPWQRHAYPVIQGTHTFKWLYSKDMANAEGSDCAWVDFIAFPAFVDYTGSEELSDLNVSMQLLPNPATERITIEAVINKQSNCQVQVINSEGRTVYITGEIPAESDGRIRHIIDISMLTPGFYTCKIISGKMSVSRPFIVY